MSYSIEFSTNSQNTLDEIFNHLGKYSQDIADIFIETITQKIDTELSMFPYMYREYFTNIRFIPFKGYVVFYKIDEDKRTVVIITIVHGSMDLNSIKF